MDRRGRRYNGQKKLNMKKVIAVIIAILVMIMFVIGIREILKGSSRTNDKLFQLAYYTVYENGKWGVIDTRGNVVISPTYEEMILIPDHTKPIFVCMEQVNYEEGNYDSKVINEKNEEQYTQYDKVEVIYNQDENHTLWYEAVLKVQKDGKYGLINLEGKELLACLQDQIEPMLGAKGVYITMQNGKKGVVDSTGKVIIENTYADITSLTTQYENGFIVKNEEGKYGVIHYDSSVAIEIKYDGVAKVYGNNMYVVKEGAIWKVVNEKGEVFVENKFQEVITIHPDSVVIKNGGKYGIITLDSQDKLPLIYDELSYAYADYYIAKKGEYYGIVDSQNEEQLPFEYTYLYYHSEADFIQAETKQGASQLLDRNFNVKVTGILTEMNQDKNYIRVRVAEEYQYYNFKLEAKESKEVLATNTLFLSKKDGKYGYVNEKGIVVVDYIYEDATEQNKYGYASVKKDGKWGAIDAKGNVIVEPTYALENHVVVDFIGTWYLAEDLNAQYYTR